MLSNTYVRQRGADDCGIACVVMLLNYAGRYDDGLELQLSCSTPAGGLSLFDLRELCAQTGLTGTCVSMDNQTLRSLSSPCILHIRNSDGNFHFIVCYRTRRFSGVWKYLIADPATGIAWMPGDEIEKMWCDGSALYMESFKPGPLRLQDHTWYALLNAGSLQKTLYVSIPMLHLSVALLGVALSWLLQRGINDSPSDKKTSLLVGIVILLCGIMLAKSLGSYFRQQMLIRLNADIRRKYFRYFLTRHYGVPTDKTVIRSWLKDIQGIQHAFTALLGVLFSEGSLLILLLAGLWYFEPTVAAIVSVYVLVLLWTGIRNSANFAASQARLSNLNRANERALVRTLENGSSVSDTLTLNLGEQAAYTERASALAGSVNKNNLLYECCGTIAVIFVLVCCLYKLRSGSISYNMLMTDVIVSFFITVLTPRICQVFPVINEGARLIRQFEKLR